jgi:hypothetical protein
MAVTEKIKYLGSSQNRKAEDLNSSKVVELWNLHSDRLDTLQEAMSGHHHSSAPLLSTEAEDKTPHRQSFHRSPSCSKKDPHEYRSTPSPPLPHDSSEAHCSLAPYLTAAPSGAAWRVQKPLRLPNCDHLHFSRRNGASAYKSGVQVTHIVQTVLAVEVLDEEPRAGRHGKKLGKLHFVPIRVNINLLSVSTTDTAP